MTEKKVWLITGAGRGLGVDIASAALRATLSSPPAAMLRRSRLRWAITKAC